MGASEHARILRLQATAWWSWSDSKLLNGKQQTPDDLDGRPTRGVGRTRTMFHNTLVVDSSIRKPGKSSKTAKRPAICRGVRPRELVGLEPCSITHWWLVRVRPAPPPSRAKPEKSKFVYSRHPASRRRRSRRWRAWLGVGTPAAVLTA